MSRLSKQPVSFKMDKQSPTRTGKKKGAAPSGSQKGKISCARHLVGDHLMVNRLPDLQRTCQKLHKIRILLCEQLQGKYERTERGSGQKKDVLERLLADLVSNKITHLNRLLQSSPLLNWDLQFGHTLTQVMCCLDRAWSAPRERQRRSNLTRT